MKAKKKALGRGLDAILQSPETDITSKDISGNYVVGAIADIDLNKIESNPFQPRTEFDDKSIIELAGSIAEQGIIQPITIRKLGYDKYQLISGERRFRAAKLAGLTDIPSYIRVANDEQMLEMALVENIHRKNLNAMEIAISYQRLIEECQLTQEKLSEKVGKDRTTVSNYVRLLKLPPEIQIAIRDEQITMGHARALINITDEKNQLNVLKKIITNSLSVRQVEDFVRKLAKISSPQRKITDQALSEKFEHSKLKLKNIYSAEIEIKRNNKGYGNIVISFKSDEDFNRIISLLEE